MGSVALSHRTTWCIDEGRLRRRAPRMLRDDGRSVLRLHPAFRSTLHRDEAEGYYLNLTSGAPVWFVMWRSRRRRSVAAPWPELVTLSYNDAGRLLDAQERVDNVPLTGEPAAWLQAYADEHYRPEPKRSRRPPSFRAPGERR